MTWWHHHSWGWSLLHHGIHANFNHLLELILITPKTPSVMHAVELENGTEGSLRSLTPNHAYGLSGFVILVLKKVMRLVGAVDKFT
jgi:hypothetical protein